MTFDRKVDSYAVLLVRPDEKEIVNWPISLLPAGAREGDILKISLNKDVEETSSAKEKVSSLLNKLQSK